MLRAGGRSIAHFISTTAYPSTRAPGPPLAFRTSTTRRRGLMIEREPSSRPPAEALVSLGARLSKPAQVHGLQFRSLQPWALGHRTSRGVRWSRLLGKVTDELLRLMRLGPQIGDGDGDGDGAGLGVPYGALRSWAPFSYLYGTGQGQAVLLRRQVGAGGGTSRCTKHWIVSAMMETESWAPILQPGLELLPLPATPATRLLPATR